MLGLLISSGIVVSHPLALAGAVVVFLAGTSIRIHLEEKLLRDAFGKQFLNWKSEVPKLIPFLKL
jgi:protein-S-isoprenylcysteine O-methyltransferase Ste14